LAGLVPPLGGDILTHFALIPLSSFYHHLFRQSAQQIPQANHDSSKFFPFFNHGEKCSYLHCISLFSRFLKVDTTLIDPLIVKLQSRVADLELAKEHTDVSASVQRERAEILISLRKIMEAMKSETGVGGASISSKEIEQLKAENKELMRVNAKQRYRIDHLVNNLRETMK
jgi:hypothetical protein